MASMPEKLYCLSSCPDYHPLTWTGHVFICPADEMDCVTSPSSGANNLYFPFVNLIIRSSVKGNGSNSYLRGALINNVNNRFIMRHRFPSVL